MKAFITGGSGFVGRSLIRALRARGDEVIAAARSNEAATTVGEAGARALQADLSDPAALARGMEGCSLVLHAAAKVEEWGPLEAFKQVNVRGTECVLEAARSAGVARFVHVGAEAVLAGGPPIRNADETWPMPMTTRAPYPLTKALAEQRVVAANSSSLCTVVVRPRFIWGRGDSSLLPKLVHAVKTGRFLWIGQGRYLTSTCHVENVCEGILLAAELGRGGESYFLTDGPPVEFREFITELLRTQRLSVPNRSMPLSLARAMASVFDTVWPGWAPIPPPISRTMVSLFGQEVTVDDSKARRELGYQAQISRKQGLQDMVTRASTTAARAPERSLA